VTLEILVEREFDLAEGPLWDSHAGLVRWVDIPRGAIHSFDLSSRHCTSTYVTSPVGSIALCSDGRVIVAAGSELRLLDEAACHPVISELPIRDHRLRFNDGAADPAGRYVIGTTSRAKPIAGAASLWSFDGSRWSEIRRSVTISNGIAWLPNGDLIYVDTPTQRIDRFAYDVDTGEVGDLVSSVAIDPRDGAPDGVALDAEGGIWVALWDGGAIRRYVDNRVDIEIAVPARLVTSVAFAGVDLATMVITTARLERNGYPKARDDLGGTVFIAALGLRGATVPLVRAPVSDGLP
jgi:sugar lactone lactonase YvrE